MIDHTIEREFDRLNFNLKAKISVPKLRENLAEINSVLQGKLFQYVNDDDSESEPSESEGLASDEEEYTQQNRRKQQYIKKIKKQDCPDRFRYWLSELLILQFEKTKDVFISESGLKNELVLELFDFIETEYFASALYELIYATFEKMESILLEELMKKP